MTESHEGYYVIRHKLSGELMPQMKRGRGYTSWNPNVEDSVCFRKTSVPRIIFGLKSAKKIVSLWNSLPNSFMNNVHPSYDSFLDIKHDGRTKEDLEIVPITIIFGEPI